MFPNIKVSSQIAAECARIDRGRLASDYFQRTEADFLAIMPPKPEVNGQSRYFTGPQLAALCIATDFVGADVKAPLAARIARRVIEAYEARPEVAQWAIVVTDNGNVATLPYCQSDLRTGFISGSRFKFAVVIDLRTYADRVDAAIAAAPKVIGGGDEG